MLSGLALSPEQKFRHLGFVLGGRDPARRSGHCVEIVSLHRLPSLGCLLNFVALDQRYSGIVCTP